MSQTPPHAASPRSPRRRSYLLLAAAVLVVVAGWSIGWFVLRDTFATQLDRLLARLADRGQVITCHDREIAGFPFRYELSCSRLEMIDGAGRSVQVAGFRSVALVYKPWHVIAEINAPGLLRLPQAGVEGILGWETARASVMTRLDRITDLDVVLEAPEARDWSLFDLKQDSMRADEAQLHLRITGEADQDLDAAASVTALSLPLLPAALEGLTASVAAHVPSGSDLARGVPLKALLARSPDGVKLRHVKIRAALGELSADLTGDLVIDRDGLLNGAMTLSTDDVTRFVAVLGEIWPDIRVNASMIAALAVAMGKQNADGPEPRVELPVRLDKGGLTIGILPLGIIPPLAP
ncbi:DUF2125 domain-containing protein [Roseibium aestuarii]|uniref:DUF2125 domain-containing protein n=1 Tax=Roseibium aestuarii TaxID=2600299 RepID=A0ABW4K3P5_9HYPH|nr:DUF2125 domain-containing protein [Roseibium aestuarii]